MCPGGHRGPVHPSDRPGAPPSIRSPAAAVSLPPSTETAGGCGAPTPYADKRAGHCPTLVEAGGEPGAWRPTGNVRGPDPGSAWRPPGPCLLAEGPGALPLGLAQYPLGSLHPHKGCPGSSRTVHPVGRRGPSPHREPDVSIPSSAWRPLWPRFHPVARGPTSRLGPRQRGLCPLLRNSEPLAQPDRRRRPAFNLGSPGTAPPLGLAATNSPPMPARRWGRPGPCSHAGLGNCWNTALCRARPGPRHPVRPSSCRGLGSRRGNLGPRTPRNRRAGLSRVSRSCTGPSP